MDEYISRPSLMGQLTRSEAQSRVRDMTGEEVYAWVLELVNVMPAGDVAPVRHVRWVKWIDGDDCWGPTEYPKCSQCGAEELVETPYCPRCGCKMDQNFREVTMTDEQEAEE